MDCDSCLVLWVSNGWDSYHASSEAPIGDGLAVNGFFYRRTVARNNWTCVLLASLGTTSASTLYFQASPL